MKPIDTLSDEEFGHELQRAIHALPDAPLALQRAAIDLWPAVPSPAANLAAAARALGQKVAAVLSFDSWAAPALAHGMRSVRGPTRHLLFSAMGRDIDLRISSSGAMYSLAGQVLGPGETERVELAPLGGGSGPLLSGELDRLGEFRIEGVTAGPCVVTLHLGGDEIVLPPIDIGE
jgi:hypothetical protein